jgi:hypothetical protein
MMNRSVMGRQMFAKGGAAFPDLSGDGKVTQKDILMGRGVVPMAEGGEVPGDVRAIFQGLVESMRGSKKDVAAYVRNNTRDLSDIAKMYPNMAAMINEGFKVTSEVPMQEYFPPEYGQSPESFAPMQPNMDTSREEMDDAMNQMRRFEELEQGDQMLIPQPPPGVMEEMPEAPPFTRLQMGGEPMAAAMEQGAMPADPMAAMGAPSPADLGSMDAAGIASQMDPEVVAIMQGAANNFGDPEQAESLEGMMDAVRGTRATEEERREELAGVVGPEDAAATPDSVLAMVQPLMLLMGAQGAMETEVDTGGIGPMAQDTMNVPVSGDMAGGIMQMAAAPPPPPEGGVPPVNFSQGGEVLRFSEGKEVPGYDVSPSYQPTKNAPLSQVPFTPFQGMIDNPAPAPAPAAKSSSVPDFGPTAAARLQQYKALMGDTGAEEDKDLAQAQFFQDLAKFGFSLMQAPKVGENPLAQAGRAALETGLGQNTLNLMAKQKAAQRAADRGLKLASITTTEAELTAARKAEADEAAALVKAKAAAAQKNRQLAFDIAKEDKIVDDVDPKTGITYTARRYFKQMPNGEIKAFIEPFKKDDGSFVIKSIPKNLQTQKFLLPNGNESIAVLQGGKFVPLKINGTDFITAAAKKERFGDKVYTATPSGYLEAPEIDITEYQFGTEEDANGVQINVAYNKSNPAEKVILGTKKSPAPQIKQIGRDFVQFTPTQDGTGFTAKKVYTAKAEEQLFTLGNTRYSYDPNTKKVTDLQTGKADPVLKVVNNRLVRVQDPNDPDSEAEVLVDLSDKKEKMKNFIFGSQAQADKFGLGTRNALVTTDTSGNIFIVGKDGQRKNIALIPDAMKGSFLPGSQAPEEYVAKLEQRVRDKKITERIDPRTGVISFSDQGTNAFNLAPAVTTLQDFRIESRNGVKTMVPVNVREGFFGDTGAKTIAEAAEDGLGFWSTIKAYVSNVASPLGDTFLSSAEVQRSKNAFRRLVILARDAFVNNPRMPVAELERVAGIFPNPDALFANRRVERDKLNDLRSTLLQAQERNMTILTSPDAESAEKDIARRNVFKVSRVLSMMTGLDTKATNDQIQQGQDVLKGKKPTLKQGQKVK